MANQWFKFYGGEYLSDPKIERLSPAERSCWVTLLCMASMEENGKIEFLTIESLLNKSGVQLDPYNDGDWERCQGIFTLLVRMKMIEIDTESTTITIKNWDKRQEQFCTNAERQAKYRENKKNNENVTPVTTKVTLEEKRIEEKRIEENNKDIVVVNDKLIYGEFKNVKLFEEEYNKLLEKLGDKNTSILIEELSSYIASKGKRYASHYATILTWARMKIQKKNDQTNSRAKPFKLID